MTPHAPARPEWIVIAVQDREDMSWMSVPEAPMSIKAARDAERDGALFMTTKKHNDCYELRIKHRRAS